MQIQPHTDLTQFEGQRVSVGGVVRATIVTIRHGNTSPFEGLHGGFGGMCVEDPHGDCRGGSTAFWRPYGTDLTIVA